MKEIIKKSMLGLVLLSVHAMSSGNASEVQGFVNRFYTVVFQRDADTEGLNYWTDALLTEERRAEDVAKGFILSNEFVQKNLDDQTYIQTLYKSFFNRAADSEGLKYWKEKLNQGTSREEVLNGFVNSNEFLTLAHSYGIKVSASDTYNANQREIDQFVTRFYQTILERTPDTDGLRYWSDSLANGTRKGTDIAQGFILSSEFTQKGLNDSQFVTVLYKAFFDRNPDSAGYNYWLEKLASGTSREEVVAGFTHSNEFVNLSNRYQIEAYEGAPQADDNSVRTLNGSIIKGPIDHAQIVMLDSDGHSISIAQAKKGHFKLSFKNTNSQYYMIESHGGRYFDEATKKEIVLSENESLKTLVGDVELTALIENNQTIAITPETTIYASLVQARLENGENITEAMSIVQENISKALIQGTSPLEMLQGDIFLKEGNLVADVPANQTEAFARNRAIAMSYMVRNLGLEAKDVFVVLEKIIDDMLVDGMMNATDLDNDGYDDNVTQAYALARSNLFQETMNRLQSGNISNGERESLRLMGIDIERLNGNLSTSQASLNVEVEAYLASTTLPILHTLPTMVDEDGSLSDAQATYTLRANIDVNVTIETPNGSWITPMWRYNNNPLPLVIRTNRGDAMSLHFENKLASDSTIHWHGFKIPAAMDGGPDRPVAPNATKTYSFTMNQPAAPLWFHPHPDMQTGKQVYMGLAGVYLIEDNITKTLESTHALPSGDKDTVLLVQDRRFEGNTTDAVRKLKYMDMQMDMDGMLGDTILVNGSVVPKQAVSTTLHRYRLYNVSNARTYKFALSDGHPFTVVGTDGGLLDHPTKVTSVTLGAAERVEIVIDFSEYAVGDKVMLVSQPFAAGMMGNMGNNTMPKGNNMNNSGMNGNRGNMGNGGMNNNGNNQSMPGMLANGKGISIMRFDIDTDEAETTTLYTSLPVNVEIKTRHTVADATNTQERQFLMSMGGMGNMQQMTFVINGKKFDPTRVDEFIEAGATEIWNIKNMSPMAHPFHAHAIQYQILSRNGVAATGIDLGWKDTFLVQPGESVKVIGKFEAVNKGDYMYHCHILEHEDAGMMGYFRVGDTGVLGPQ